MNFILCIDKYIYYLLILVININCYKVNIVRVGVWVFYCYFLVKKWVGEKV